MSEYEYQGNGMSQELDWNSTIEHDSEFTLLTEGDYSFTVVKFERGRHNGSDKLPPCNKAILTLECTDGINTTQITHNLFLHRKTEGMLCAFFTAIGQRRHGEKLAMNWNQVVGSSGTCKVGVRKWTGKDGTERESNEIRKFYEKDAAPAPQAAPAPAPQAPAPQQQSWNTGYRPGSF